jgi:CRISPR-associated protein Csb1
MSEKQDEAKKQEEPAPRKLAPVEFVSTLLADDAVAIIVKQQLAPDDEENPVIFPPTYLKARSKAFSSKDAEGEEKKETKQEQQQSVYNLDGPPNGENVCEIDSVQSDGNRSEPLFKSEKLKKLVPQIIIDVNGTPVNILDAGHRAGDAVVRLSSLAAEFHTAFQRADIGDHSLLASLAPTSLLYGAWDSRSTQTKLQRIIKASVRAENVRPLTRSATFIPAVDYVAVGAIKEELDVGEGDSNPLSSEGMKYALASQTLGGVRLTDPKKLVRTIKINLVALRQLRANVTVPKPDDKATDQQKEAYKKAIDKAIGQSAARTTAMREYILALALVAATSDPDLNLREGCNLRIVGDRFSLVCHRKEDQSIELDKNEVVTFAEKKAEAFFNAMSIGFESKDHLDARFEKDVAEEFLGLTDSKGKLSSAERDKVRKLGPITRETLTKYKAEKKRRDKASDPVESLRKLVEAIAVDDRKNKFKTTKPVTNLRDRLKEIAEDAESDEILKVLATKISTLLTNEAGAKERKPQMLACFPATAEPPTASETPATPEAQ